MPTRTRGEKCPLVSANFWRAKSRTGIGTFFRTRPAFSHGNSANSGAKQAPSRGIIPNLNVRSKTSSGFARFAELARFERDAGTKIGPTFHARIPRITVVRLRKLPQINIKGCPFKPMKNRGFNNTLKFQGFQILKSSGSESPDLF